MNKGKYNLLFAFLLKAIKASLFSCHLKVANLIHIPILYGGKQNRMVHRIKTPLLAKIFLVIFLLADIWIN